MTFCTKVSKFLNFLSYTPRKLSLYEQLEQNEKLEKSFSELKHSDDDHNYQTRAARYCKIFLLLTQIHMGLNMSNNMTSLIGTIFLKILTSFTKGLQKNRINFQNILH